MKFRTSPTLLSTAGKPGALSRTDRDSRSLPAEAGEGRRRHRELAPRLFIACPILALLLTWSPTLAQEHSDDSAAAFGKRGTDDTLHVSPAMDSVTTSTPFKTRARSQIEILPVLSYDTDVGFGYGVKGFFLNQLGWGESFDILLFNTTKGERWYRFVFSFPDIELRQGTQYPFAIDAVLDYDKWINNSFFGIGNTSRFEDREVYTREPFEASITLSRGFSRQTVGQVGLRFKGINNLNFSDSSRLRFLPPSLNSFRASYHSLFMSYRFDSRERFINPSRGIVLHGEVEYAPRLEWTNVELSRISGTFQYYAPLVRTTTVAAFRIQSQFVAGPSLPTQTLLSLGGNQTLRGSPQDRFLDRIMMVLNAEVRFPLVWRIGGVIGFDAGNVWHTAGEIGLGSWKSNPVTGLRLYMDTFVVRVDVGFGSEVTGFFMNFGHLF